MGMTIRPQVLRFKNVWICVSLIPHWHSYLWPAKMSATGPAYTDVDTIKLLQYFRHFPATQFREIFPTTQKIPAECQFLPFWSWTQQAVMADTDKALWGHMHQEPAYKLHAWKREFSPLPFVTVILYRKSNTVIIHPDNPVVADGDPVGILAKVGDHRLRTVKSLLAIRHPVYSISGIDQFLESIMVTVLFSRTMKYKLVIFP